MRKETKKKVRILGAVLFFLYLLALTYFLFFAEGYGRSVEGRMYAYNLQPFREIKRFWVHREMLGTFAVFCNLAGNVIGFTNIPFITFAAVGAQLPFSIRPMVRFWKLRSVRRLMKSCMNG